ncbi:hypothetical protein K450DRAFT_214494 [Umbelopsis ramanniana AG]|uniref:Zinc phosphodiesterase ELAC protein 2 n=1 Tax=Umbelopsis ramanniana AG TaxID=1314678 RepID=A0AAD5E3T7_UMBRA|nr:uncharacterized protein K450DRAFT_214494 [Umbelopsis ramanniana AG]KAI8576219.1 hypothetical protein K450DRAFT_214494 [Umbelopsis ramanniana AG]
MPIVLIKPTSSIFYRRFGLISNTCSKLLVTSPLPLQFKPFGSKFHCQQHRGMKAYLQVIGGVNKERAPSLILHYDNQRYMFNCGEGTQRLCVENKLKLAKMKNIFLSRVDWDCVGGLPGMLLTLADGGIKNISLHGPKNLTHFMVSTRHFVYRTSMSVETHEFQHDSDLFQDENLRVVPVIAYPTSYVPELEDKDSVLKNQEPSQRKRALSKSGSSSDESDSDLQQLSPRAQQKYRKKVLTKMFVPSSPGNNDHLRKKGAGYILQEQKQSEDLANAANAKVYQPASDESQAIVQEIGEDVQPPRKKPTVQQQQNANRTRYMNRRLPSTKPIPAAISYICRGPEVKGKFNKAAAVALGIKPGPMYGKLHRGESITLDDGTVVTPDRVCDPPIPGHVFIVVDCPSPEYIRSLTSSSLFSEHQGAVNGSRLSVIVHMLGKDVLENQQYQEWMNTFPSNVQHIIGNQEYNSHPVLFDSHALSQLKLSRLNNEMFPIPWYSNSPEKDLTEIPALPKLSHPMENLLQFDLEPKPKLQKLQNKLFDHIDPNSEANQAVEGLTEYLADANEAKQAIMDVDSADDAPGANVEITTLGTGSSVPSKYRNVSATLVEIPDSGSILLDAGENTYGQMLRIMGRDGIDKAVNNLKAIFVSHLHADHHLGVVHILAKWSELNRGNDQKMYVVSPWAFKLWLEEYSDVQDFGIKNIIFINNEDVLYDKEVEPRAKQRLENMQGALGLESLKTVHVIHCRWAYGVSLKHNSGWKLVYSGDTRPCPKLVEVGKDATVLLHEATLEDDMVEEALAKRHSTTKEAVQIGQEMNAKYTLLTHFSQRYPKIPVFTDAHNQVGISFDMMRVKIRDLPTLPKYVKALQTLYKDTEKEEVEDLGL